MGCFSCAFGSYFRVRSSYKKTLFNNLAFYHRCKKRSNKNFKNVTEIKKTFVNVIKNDTSS